MLENWRQGFWDYVVNSNERLGEWQVMGLAKIVHFARDATLHEIRQKEIKDECLRYWKVPNETRKAPPHEKPQVGDQNKNKKNHFKLLLINKGHVTR